MNTETSIMTKADMPNLRLEIRDENLLYMVDLKLERKMMKIDIHGNLHNMPSLIGFEIKPIFSKPKEIADAD